MGNSQVYQPRLYEGPLPLCSGITNHSIMIIQNMNNEQTITNHEWWILYLPHRDGMLPPIWISLISSFDLFVKFTPPSVLFELAVEEFNLPLCTRRFGCSQPPHPWGGGREAVLFFPSFISPLFNRPNQFSFPCLFLPPRRKIAVSFLLLLYRSMGDIFGPIVVLRVGEGDGPCARTLEALLSSGEKGWEGAFFAS